MKTLREFIAIANFLGDDMTEDQANKLMDEAKAELSQTDIETLSANVGGSFYTAISEYHGECGIIPGYLGR